MAGLSRFERYTLLLTAGFVLFTSGWFLAQQGQPEPYTVITETQPEPSLEASPSETDSSWPESLLEGEQINLNSADLDTLNRLPGIGTVKAQAILDYRESFGPFQSVDELLSVSGIGPATLEQIRPYITV